MGHKVQLALYDLSRGMARSMSMAILGKQVDGIWHTGLIVYGKEYFFGGGLQNMPHQEFVAMHGGVHPEQYIDLGETDLPQEVFEDFNREVSPRFTPQTYDLLKHNCNNYTNEAAIFLLGQGIPEHIINLPNEVLSSPVGQMIRPMLEQMTTQMNGADPFAAQHYREAGGGGLGGMATPNGFVAPTAPSPSPPAQASVVGQEGAGSGFPMLEKHKKPLLGSEASGTAGAVVGRLKASAASVEGFLDTHELSLLDALPGILTQPKSSPVAGGSYTLMRKIIEKGPDKAEFSCLVLLRLMVLHHLEGHAQEEELEEMITYLAKRLGVDDGFASAQTLALALCTATNMFGTSHGGDMMTRPGIKSPCLDAALRGLQHTRVEVRQMASALLNNYSLAIADKITDTEDSELSDEATHVLFGSLDGIGDEADENVGLRRLLSAGRLLLKLGEAGASLVNEVGFVDQVAEYSRKISGGEVKKVTEEVLRLLS